MTSKYDDYWAGQLPRIRAQLQLAADGTPASVDVPGLPLLGTRQSWYGVAEVRAQQVTYSSMAHATSLGRTVAASGICAQWPERTFRFTVGASGGVLTITAAAGHPRRDAPAAAPGPGGGPGTARPQGRRQPAPQAQPAGHDRVPAGVPADPDRGLPADTFVGYQRDLGKRLFNLIIDIRRPYRRLGALEHRKLGPGRG